MKNVAVYWDFENIHASLCSRAKGPSWYRDNVFTKQPHLVDITSIMQYIAELGNVNINRAYANWSFLHAYNYDLQNYAVDLIQLFPRGRFGKNGADIRMSIEIIEDIALNRHIDTVVLIGGDSDYVSVAQKVRQRGKSIIGIGVQETSNQYWVKSCNEFKYYSSLLVKSSKIESLEAEGYEVEDIEAAKTLLKRTIESSFSGSGQDYILKASLKPLILRFDPSFDESNYGFKSFADFLAECADIIEISQGNHDHLIRLKVDTPPGARSHSVIEASTGNKYEAILRKQKTRLLKADLFEPALRAVFAMLYNSQVNTLELKQLLTARMSEQFPDFTDTDATKVRALLYKAQLFRYQDNNKTTLTPEIASAEDLLFRVRFMLLKRILDNIADEACDEALLSELLFGDEQHIADIHLLVAEYNRSEPDD